MNWLNVILRHWFQSPSLRQCRSPYERAGGWVVLLGACTLTACEKSAPAEGTVLVEEAPVAVKSNAGLQTAELMVEGTSCASCAVSIRRQLHQLQGIGDIREGSTKQHLFVEFDPKLVTTEQLIKAVSDAGYEAEVWVHSTGASSVREHGG